MAKQEFDWIDDAFDDKKTAEDMERARGTGFAGVLLAVVILAAIAIMIVGLVSVVGVMQSA